MLGCGKWTHISFFTFVYYSAQRMSCECVCFGNCPPQVNGDVGGAVDSGGSGRRGLLVGREKTITSKRRKRKILRTEVVVRSVGQ